MLCTNHCFNNTLSKNDGLTVFESSLEAKWDPLGDRKEKYQKISIFGSLRSQTVCILGARMQRMVNIKSVKCKTKLEEEIEAN